MGLYLNPGNEGFRQNLNSKIYVDKTMLIAYTNSVIRTEQKYVCVSRPRRFGKSTAANMLTAYYTRGCDSEGLFEGLKIAEDEDRQGYREGTPAHTGDIVNRQCPQLFYHNKVNSSLLASQKNNLCA